MIRQVILDTGPLVAFLHAGDQHHAWSRDIMATIAPPLLTCEAVLSETTFLLAPWPKAIAKIGMLIQSGVIEVQSPMGTESSDVFKIMKRYSNVPMSFADACLVSMSEQLPHSRLLTLDSDFEIYRRHRRKKIPLLAPWLPG